MYLQTVIIIVYIYSYIIIYKHTSARIVYYYLYIVGMCKDVSSEIVGR